MPGVWLFHIGSSYSFENVIPASVGGVLATGPPFDAELEHATTPEYSEYSESDYPEFQSPTLPEFVEAGPDPSLLQSPGQPQVQLYGEDVPFTSSPEIPETPNSESGPREYPAVPEPRNRPPEDSGLPQRPVPEHTILEVYPNRQGESPRYTPNSQVESELEGVDIDTGGEELFHSESSLFSFTLLSFPLFFFVFVFFFSHILFLWSHLGLFRVIPLLSLIPSLSPSPFHFDLL